MDVISKQFMEEYDRGLKQNALVPINGKIDQVDRTVVKQVVVDDTPYSPENGVVTLPKIGDGDFLPLTGGVLTGSLDVNKQVKAATFLASHNGVGKSGTAGWVGLSIITVTDSYASQPLKFRVTQRGRFGGEITLRFTNVAAASDADIDEFSYTGNISAARIVKSGTNFSLYIQKSDAWDNIAISLVDVGSYANSNITVTWTNIFSEGDPGGTAAVGNTFSSMRLPEEDTVFVTYDNIVAKTEKYGGGFENGGGQYLYFSDDVGATWSAPIDNTLGNDQVLMTAYNADQIATPWGIVHAHVFSDGSVLMCTFFKCFYTKDYQNIIECTVYDYKSDDTPGNPPVYDMRNRLGNLRHGFYSEMYHDQYFFHNGVEMEVFGEYKVEWYPKREEREYLDARMWYIVYAPGQTPVIKCAFRSGTTEIDGRVIKIRHFHNIAYCKANGRFYITTGDEEAGDSSLDHNEIYFLEASYDVGTDKWTFRIIGEGYRYKFGHIWFDEKYAYILTDYTQNHYEEYKGILRCPINGLDNINNYKNIYTCPSGDWGEIAITNIVIDNNGNKVLFPDSLGDGLIWTSSQAFNFKKVKLNRNILIGYDFTGPNLNGDIYAVPDFIKSNYCYNLTKMFREHGIQDFFKTTINQPSANRTSTEYLPLTGGILTGSLDVSGQMRASAILASHSGVGKHGNAGWVCLANIRVVDEWASQPLKFRVTQRRRFGGEITLRFTNVATPSSAEIDEFSYTGDIAGARIVKSGANFSLYIQKSEAWDSIAISLVDMGAYANERVVVTWTEIFSASEPGGTAATCRYYFSETAYLEYDAASGSIRVVGATLINGQSNT